MSKNIVITGGGTGGHLKIADVFIDEFKAKGFEVIYIGSTSGQDKSWFENDNRLKEAIFLETSGVVNKSVLYDNDGTVGGSADLGNASASIYGERLTVVSGDQITVNTYFEVV